MREDNDTVYPCAYDYAFMILSHSTAVLLSLSSIAICGIPSSHSTSKSSDGNGVDKRSAMRYCGLGITALVEGNQSANLFPVDLACNLYLIAKETGMKPGDFIGDEVLAFLETRAAE